MTGSTGAFGGTRKPFLLAYVALAAALVALGATSALWPQRHAPQAPPRAAPLPKLPPEHHAAIPSVAWGRATQRTLGLSVTLGPVADRRRRYERGFSRSDRAPVALLVSNDRGRTFFALAGTPMGQCGYHWEGFGVNAIMAARDCVPVWAVDESGAHARYWLRVENLATFARVVLLKYG